MDTNNKRQVNRGWTSRRARLPPSSRIPETMADKMAGKLQIYADEGSLY